MATRHQRRVDKIIFIFIVLSFGFILYISFWLPASRRAHHRYSTTPIARGGGGTSTVNSMRQVLRSIQHEKSLPSSPSSTTHRTRQRQHLTNTSLTASNRLITLLQKPYLPLKEISVPPSRQSELPLILFWTSYFTSAQHPLVEKGRSAFDKCRNRCDVSARHAQLEQAGAVIFHAQNWLKSAPLDHINANEDGEGDENDGNDDYDSVGVFRNRRKPEQLFIFYTLESPHHSVEPTDVIKFPRDFFNATLTYRLDSDFVATYESSYPRAPPVPRTEEVNFAANKTKHIISIISNCATPSKRQALADELSQYMRMDQFGECGVHATELPHCPRRGGGRPNCERDIIQQYKFILTFENSLCQDYLTEKIFKALAFGTVPVVLSHTDLSHFVPPHSYVDVRRFHTVAQLAAYLNYLDTNATAYNEYFQWRFYQGNSTSSSSASAGWPAESTDRLRPENEVFCQVCDALHDARKSGVNAATFSNVYANVTDWYRKSCIKPERVPILQEAIRTNRLRSSTTNKALVPVAI